MFKIAARAATTFFLAILLSGGAMATDWSDEALALQEQLDMQVPLTQALWVGTHNSYNAKDWSDAYTIDPNQTHSPKDQLRKGVRELTFDAWDYGNTLRLCHGGCNAFGSEKKFRRGLEQVRDFLEEGNQNSVILLKIEADGFFGQIANQLEGVLGDYIFKPTEGYISDDDGCAGRFGLEPEFLTKADVVAADRNVIVIYAAGQIDSCPSSDFKEWVHVGLEYQATGWQSSFDKPSDEDDCEAMVDDNTMTRLHDPNTWLIEDQKFTSSNIDDYLGCLNVIEMFNFDGDNTLLHEEINPNKLVWSWANGQPDNDGNEDCAAVTTGGRFHDTSCNDEKPFACYSDLADTWEVTTAAGPWSEGFAACADSPGYGFAVPPTARQMEALTDRMGHEEVWVNYHDLSEEGRWQPQSQGEIGFRKIAAVGDTSGSSTFDHSSHVWESRLTTGRFPSITRIMMGVDNSSASLLIYLSDGSEMHVNIASGGYTYIDLEPTEAVEEYGLCYDSDGITYMRFATSRGQQISWGSGDGTCVSGRFSARLFAVHGHSISKVGVIKSLGFYTTDDYRLTVDNSSDQFATSGSWTTSSHSPGYEGDDYLYSDLAAGGSAWYFFENLPSAGYYNVYARWAADVNRSQVATYLIKTTETFETVVVDQTKNGGRDNLLGTFYIDGAGGLVILGAGEAPDGGYIIADAITLERTAPPMNMVAMSWDGQGQGEALYELSADAADTEAIASISGDHTCVSDLDFQPGTGTLFAIDCDGYQNSGGTLFTIDQDTGVATRMGTLHGDRTAATAIAFHPDQPEVLYAINREGSGWGKVLYTIDVNSGETTEIGTLWGDRTHATSIDFDSSGTLYAINNSYSGGSGKVLYSIDTSTAETTEVGTLSGDRTYASSIRFGANDVLYAINWADQQGTGTVLYTLSTLDATTTDVATLSGDHTHATALAIRH